MNRTTSCVHHWIIAAASPLGGASAEMPAQCRNCGAERVFHNTTSRPAFVPYGNAESGGDEYRFGTRSSRREEFRLSDQ